MEAVAAKRPLERRTRARQRALLAGKLVNADTTVTIDCTIRNLSPGGALVETATPQLLPRMLHLLHLKDGVAWDAEVIWRRGSRVGLRLLDRHDLHETTDRQLRALRAIWSQMALR